MLCYQRVFGTSRKSGYVEYSAKLTLMAVWKAVRKAVVVDWVEKCLGLSEEKVVRGNFLGELQKFLRLF